MPSISSSAFLSEHTAVLYLSPSVSFPSETAVSIERSGPKVFLSETGFPGEKAFEILKKASPSCSASISPK